VRIDGASECVILNFIGRTLDRSRHERQRFIIGITLQYENAWGALDAVDNLACLLGTAGDQDMVRQPRRS
jgi:hypothetical protein